MNIIFEAPGHLYWKDTKGICRGANNTQAISLGCKSGKELIGKTAFDFYPKEQAEAIHKIDMEVMKTKKEYCIEEIVNNREGKKTIFLSRKIPLYDPNTKEVIGIIGTSIDITESKQAELAKQQFIMNMAHDLRTPLSGIIGLSNIQSKEGTHAVDRQHGQWIEDAGEQLLELLNSVLEVTAAEYQIESIAKDTILFQQFADELRALMLPAIVAKELDFKVKLDVHLPIIITDRIKLKRLVLNLLANAIKFTKKGKISLEIKLLSIEKNKAKVEIFVTDTGIGIAEDKLDKIFDRFYRAHPSYEAQYTGYGIGLFLVKKTVELLDGKIKVSSQEGKGSCFALEFIFPLAEENPELAACPILQPQPDSFKSYSEVDKHSVLVAEDNTLVLHVVKNLLVNLDYDVITVTDGKAALNALQTQCFHWALLDIGLPILAGTEVVKAYRQWEKEHNKPRIPLFALTAHAIDEVKEKCEAVGFDYILNKPFTIKDVQIIKLFMENKN
ncbi:MAG TPA: ATP-binding protein [Candidatus Aquirickettsiella sp.]